MKIAVILDEISTDFEKAVNVVKDVGMNYVELRILDGKNVAQLRLEEAKEYSGILKKLDLKVCSIASPLFKCFLPGEEKKGEVGDQFGFTINDYNSHLNLVDHLLEIAEIFETDMIRAFTFWKVKETTDEKLIEISRKIEPVLDKFENKGLRMAIENEPSCYVQTGRQLGKLLMILDHPSVGALWDPGNAKLCDENEKEGFESVKDRIFHVHIKDFTLDEGAVKFVPPGKGIVNFEDAMASLFRIGYDGFISFEFILGGVERKELEESFRRFKILVEKYEKIRRY